MLREEGGRGIIVDLLHRIVEYNNVFEESWGYFLDSCYIRVFVVWRGVETVHGGTILLS